MTLLDSLFTTEEMQSIFSDRARLQGMLDFEAALARAEARTGVVPPPAAVAISARCQAERFDPGTLARAAASAGNLAIPLIKELTTQVGREDEEAMRYVHWGATSQDAIDTGTVLQLRAALDLLDRRLDRLADALARLAQSHKATPLAGRTWLQQGPPVTFGLKAAGWLSAVERHCARLRALTPRVLVLQFGGATGTLAALGPRALPTAQALAEELQLGLPDLPWHAHRDRFAEVATVLGLLGGTLGKIARDIALLSQTEIGEAAEPHEAGRGASSTMPHKRNPVGAAVVLAAATRLPALVATLLAAMVQEHERGLGGWHAEWETLPEMFLLADGAVAHLTHVAEGLKVDPERMRENLSATRGLIMAEAVTLVLGGAIGRARAHELVERACAAAIAERRSLRELLAADAEIRRHLTESDIDRLLDPSAYLGAAEEWVERALAARPENK